MADKVQQTVTDYEGGSGANIKLPTKSHGENSFNEAGGSVAPPGEDRRFGGKGFAQRLSRAQSEGSDG